MKSINPATMELIKTYQTHTDQEAQQIAHVTHLAWQSWKQTSFEERKRHMLRLARLLREQQNHLATLITLEMGKVIKESIAEVLKCAWVCEYYAEQAETMLEDEFFEGDGRQAFASFEPLGTVLAVMPWNFPLWQVFRFAAPGLMAGNACLLKHASNVPGCALEIESLFQRAGFPTNLFRALLISGSQVGKVLECPTVQAVTLTGSEWAGSQVASKAGLEIKKSLLELGGSDAYMVFDDADLEICTQTAVIARMMNAGQSCIAAKRFIIQDAIYDRFRDIMYSQIQNLTVGDPMDHHTQIGPLARPDLRDELHNQVIQSQKMGAKVLLGGQPVPGTACFYQPTLMDDITSDMPVFKEETFGPVLPLIRFKTEQEAIDLANRSSFGLGGSLWTADTDRGIRLARQMETGAVFINGMTKSDPRLPFGGVGISGYGRELSYYGIKEFVNIKTIWLA
ncbi:MAG: succinate-semialdehyde dehydrogenase [Acidobacteria bacterium]|nr:MAG: succinate-semialdehyde dehydrogenase [Acidobacteriota bacterium]